MTTITITITTTRSPTDARQEAAREQAALARLQAAVATMRAWRQLATAPSTCPALAGRVEAARCGAGEG